MADLTSALFRIDPTEGLIEYVQAIKPYHTKVLEVLVEYVYTEQINATVLDRWTSRIGLARTNVDVGYFDEFATPPWTMQVSNARADVIYACGYGHKWSESGLISPEATIVTQVIEADTSTNSFIIQDVAFSQYNCVVIDTQSNQLLFATPYAITGVNPFAKTWTVSGDLTTGTNPLLPGMSIYVNSNSGPGVNKEYTVQTVAFASGATTITVLDSVSLLATATGTVNIAMAFDNMPYWDAGMQVQLQSTGTLPTGITPGGLYYFVPTAIPGVFNLSSRRYPQEYSEITDLTGLGTGQLQINRVEPFIPGQTVIIAGSYLTRNDGTYNIGAITSLGEGAYRLTVIQTIPHDSPPLAPYDGQISLSIGGYDEPAYCAIADAPDVHADTYIHEVLKFSFEINMQDYISADIRENEPNGYGNMPWGDDTSPYGEYTKDVYPYTATAPGTGAGERLILPTGFDTQLFDVGSMDETLEFAPRNYGTTLYPQ